MKTLNGKTAVTLGELIENGYLDCGKCRTMGIIRLAAKSRLIVFSANLLQPGKVRRPGTRHLQPRLALARLVPPFGETDLRD